MPTTTFIAPASSRSPLPLTFIPLYILFLLLSTTLPPKFHLPPLSILLLSAPIFLFYTTGHAGDDYALGTHLIIQLYTFGELRVLSDLKELRRVERGGAWTAPGEVGKKFGECGWWERGRLSMGVWGDMRRVGWSGEVKGVRPVGTRGDGRWYATFRYLARGIVNFIWMDLLLYLRYDIIGSLHDWPHHSRCPFWAAAYAGTILSWFYVRAMLEFYTSVSAILTLPTHLCIPSDYPHVSAPWTEAYTVRSLWGRSWHQLCRSFNVVYGRAVCEWLGLRRGSLMSAYVQLFVAFAMTTLSHWWGALMMSGRLHGEGRFFMLQPLAIMLEDGVLAVGRRLGVKGGWRWRVLGYVWVASWVVWSGWHWWDAMELRDTFMWSVLRLNVTERVVQWCAS